MLIHSLCDRRVLHLVLCKFLSKLNRKIHFDIVKKFDKPHFLILISDHRKLHGQLLLHPHNQHLQEHPVEKVRSLFFAIILTSSFSLKQETKQPFHHLYLLLMILQIQYHSISLLMLSIYLYSFQLQIQLNKI